MEQLQEQAVASLWGAGVFGVEMFLLDDGTILLNEVAPRPHNTGHYTYEACECDQFENHLRAVLGLPLGGTALRVGARYVPRNIPKNSLRNSRMSTVLVLVYTASNCVACSSVQLVKVRNSSTSDHIVQCEHGIS
jgi:formate-dependent phosphoribosylglycinamide formyltransferase (GAR transformylase)